MSPSSPLQNQAARSKSFDDGHSPANRLLLLRKLHGDLKLRLGRPQSAEEFLSTLEEIKAISALATKESGDGQ